MWGGEERQFYLAVCARGHIVRDGLASTQDAAAVDPYCGHCGAPVITGCQECGAPFPGSTEGPLSSATMVITPDTRPDAFCQRCGKSLPWATTDEKILDLQNRLEFQALSEPEQLALIDEMAVLIQPVDEASDDKKVSALSRIQKLAPEFFAVGVPVFKDLVTAGIRRELGWD